MKNVQFVMTLLAVCLLSFVIEDNDVFKYWVTDAFSVGYLYIGTGVMIKSITNQSKMLFASCLVIIASAILNLAIARVWFPEAYEYVTRDGVLMQIALFVLVMIIWAVTISFNEVLEEKKESPS